MDIHLFFFILGKALLLLNEDGFKQRSLRSGDILHKALQQHHALIKSRTCQSKDNFYQQTTTKNEFSFE